MSNDGSRTRSPSRMCSLKHSSARNRGIVALLCCESGHQSLLQSGLTVGQGLCSEFLIPPLAIVQVRIEFSTMPKKVADDGIHVGQKEGRELSDDFFRRGALYE